LAIGYSAASFRRVTASHRSQSGIEHVDHKIGIRFSDTQRWFDSKRVPIEAAFTNE
jgi:hypothetical protein